MKIVKGHFRMVEYVNNGACRDHDAARKYIYMERASNSL